MRGLIHAFLGALCLLTGQAFAADPVLGVSEAWIREAPPGADVLAGYLRLENPAGDAVVVGTFQSRDFDHIEVHRTVVEEGIARMLPVERLEILPGETVALEPGGMHLMLFRPVRSLRQDDRVVFSLELADGHSQTFEATVRRDTGDDGHRHHHHHKH
jgi:copper(I)-binding protein